MLFIIVSWPILLIIALLIFIEDRGPVFFFQERLGQFGRKFQIIKFRTMIVNAEKVGDGIKVKSENDSRITKIGSFLRKSSLDELPQLINILKGEMSIVGPRPPVTYHPYSGYDSYPHHYKKRFDMKPGLTGLAQIKVRNGVSWDERIPIDIQYVEKFSLLLDLRIILVTFLRVIKPQNIELKVDNNEDTN